MIYTVSKKNYLLTIVLVSILLLYWCNQNTVNNTHKTENKFDLNTTIPDINKPIENLSGLNTKSDTKIKEDKLYQNKKEWFSIQILTWREVRENINWLLVSICPPRKLWNVIKENLSINTDTQSGNQTIEEYYTQQKEWIQNRIKDFKEISKEEYKIGKEKWIKVIYQWTLWVNKLQWQQIIFYKNWKIFLITYTATQNTFNQHLDNINEILKSFEF